MLAFLFAALGAAQQPALRTVHLVNLGSPQGLQEASIILRTVCHTDGISVDEASASISFTDTPEAAALAEWTLAAIDTGGPDHQEYRVPGAADDVVKVVYMTSARYPVDFQEMITQLRQVLDVTKVFNAFERRAIVFRGNSALVAACTWLIARLDRPFDPGAAAASYEFPGTGGGNVKVYYLHNLTAPKPTQALLTALRNDANVRHVFLSWSPRAIALRGTGEQIAQADQIVARLDAPAAP